MAFHNNEGFHQGFQKGFLVKRVRKGYVSYFSCVGFAGGRFVSSGP